MKITIDGKTIDAEKGETILACALRHDIQIPHLCTHPSLPPFGACRLCVVEVEDMRGYPTSCTTPVAEDMVIHTHTPALNELRRNILALIMLEHPSACLVCGKRDLCEAYRPDAEKTGRTTGCHTCNNKSVCEVRVLAEQLGFEELPVAPTYHQRPIERSHPFIDRDLNLCILCGRCVRICKHQQGRAVIDFIQRGSRTHIGQAFGHSLLEAGCQFCGSCVDVCPTGSLADRYAKWYGKPDTAGQTTCLFCDAACALEVGVTDGKVTTVQAVDENMPLCVLGRFTMAEFLNGTDRIRVPYVRVGDVLRQTEWDATLEQTATRLQDFVGDGFAFICDTTSTLEDRHVFKAFTQDVMKSNHYMEIKPDARGLAQTTLPQGTKAVWLTGNFVDRSALKDLEVVIVQDCYPSAASGCAHIVLPAAVLAEIDGTVPDASGQRRPLHKVCAPTGQARADWWIVCEVAKALGGAGFTYESVDSITQASGLTDAELYVERDRAPAAALDFTGRRTWFRGHRLEEKVHGLRELPVKECIAVDVAVERHPGHFKIVKKHEIVPNTHEIVIEAQEVAKKARAGQFVIVMVDEASERVPYTLCNWDAHQGTITLVVLEKGQSSRKLILLQPGDSLAHVIGPLGVPLEIKHYGTVVLAGGCYGLGGILPIARAMKEAGNHVIGIVEARSHYLHYYGDELKGVCDVFIQTTIDGSLLPKGHALDVIGQKLKDQETIDLVVAVGCPFMMMLTARQTKPYGVKTLAALNPIMVDGTGMCGACRITVGTETRFACVDGPFFDAHLVDWDEVRDRRVAYSAAEIQSLGRTESVVPDHGDTQPCTCLHEP